MQIKNLKIRPIGSIVLLIVVIFLCKPGSVEGDRLSVPTRASITRVK